jgi:hypothetical protein
MCLELLSINVLYYVMFQVVWIPGRVAAAFATANGEPNKHTIIPPHLESENQYEHDLY